MIGKKAEKILKYKYLRKETQCMQNVKTEVIPVITGATGTTSKSFMKYLSHVKGKHVIMEQKTAIMGTHTWIVTVMEMYYVQI
jgi:hypothetical protein